MFGGFGGDDPFGNNIHRSIHGQMRAMDNMMNFMMNDASMMLDGFGSGFHPHPMIANSGRHPNIHGHHDMMLSPFGGFPGPSFMGNIMGQMNSMQHRAMTDPNSVVFSNSTMVSFDGSNQPKVVQQSVRKVGDAKETRRAMRDGAEEHLSVGHSVGDRSHIIEKKRNKEGRVKQNQRFVNINEADAEQFNNEFKSNAMNFFSRPQDRQAAIESNKERNPGPRQRVDPTPIVTIPDDEDETPRQKIYSTTGIGRTNGPIIRELDDEDNEVGNPKRRRGLYGKYVG